MIRLFVSSPWLFAIPTHMMILSVDLGQGCIFPPFLFSPINPTGSLVLAQDSPFTRLVNN
jgi:hypothetical protein